MYIIIIIYAKWPSDTLVVGIHNGPAVQSDTFLNKFFVLSKQGRCGHYYQHGLCLLALFFEHH